MEDTISNPLDFIRDYLVSSAGLAAEDITGDRTFDSLGLDSIAQVEMFVTLSDHYGVHLDDSQASGDMTLARTAHLVTAELGHKAGLGQGTSPAV